MNRLRDGRRLGGIHRFACRGMVALRRGLAVALGRVGEGLRQGRSEADGGKEGERELHIGGSVENRSCSGGLEEYEAASVRNEGISCWCKKV